MNYKIKGIITYGLILIMLTTVIATGITGCFKKAPNTSTTKNNNTSSISGHKTNPKTPTNISTEHNTNINTANFITSNTNSNQTSTPSNTTNSPSPTATGIVEEKTLVGIATKENASYADSDELVRKAIANAGGLESIITKGCIVLIKPNLVYPDPPETTVTSWRVTQTVVDMVLELGASKVIIAEATPLGNTFLATGFNNIKNAELFDMNTLSKDDCYLVKPEKGLTGVALYVPKMYVDADVIITIPKMKTHGNTEVTLSLKNAIGVPPTHIYMRGSENTKLKLHDLDISKSIIDLNLIRKPDFTVIDAIRAGEGNGPKNTKFVNSNMIIAAKDIVAGDTVAAYYMGYNVQEVKHLLYAREIELGNTYLYKMNIVGADIYAIRKNFIRPK